MSAACPSGGAVRYTTPPDMRTLDVRIVDQIDPRCGKACVYPDGHIEVERAQWAAWSPLQRAAALAHEVAHMQGADCERCADQLGGHILRQWGYTRAAAESLGSIVKSRPTASLDAVAGFVSGGRVTPGAARVDQLAARQAATAAQVAAVQAARLQPTTTAVSATAQTPLITATAAPVVNATATVPTPVIVATAPVIAPQETGTVVVTPPAPAPPAKPDNMLRDIVVAVVSGYIVLTLLKGAK